MSLFVKLQYLVRPTPAHGLLGPMLEQFARWEWALTRRPPAPGSVKLLELRRYAQEYQLPVLVETGTFLGDTVQALHGQFREIHTIELAPALAERARLRFAALPHIHVHEGDSGQLLPALARSLAEPALFWLDGHYSGGQTARADQDTPVRAELQSLLTSRSQADVILIDDARLFGTDPAYPSLAEVAETVRTHGAGRTHSVQDDIIRIVPRRV